MPASIAARGLNVRVIDSAGRAIPPGSEIRLRDSATGALIGARLVDSGSGYNAQSVAPVHFGLGDTTAIDIEVTVVRGRARNISTIRRVDVAELAGRTLALRLTQDGSLVVRVGRI